MLDMQVLAEEIATIVADEVARAIEPVKAENQRLEGLLRSMLADAVAALPVPQDGRSVTVEDVAPLIRETVAAEVAALPAPKDGASVTAEDVAPLIRSEVAAAVSALPPAKDGVSVTLEDVEPMIGRAVAEAVASIPPAKDGESANTADLEPMVRNAVCEAVAALPAPKDGASVTIADVEPLISRAVADAVAALPAAKDGRGIAGAMIDRHGSLIVTLSDGTLTDLGHVEGKDGEPGLGFEDMRVEHDGERGFVLVFERGEQAKRFEFSIPAVIDRGVFKDGAEYGAGDGVTWGGSYWIAQKATATKPDGPESGWRLAVKRGRDGKDLTK